MPEPIRILHVLGTTQLGGAESRIMDLYRHVDRERVQFDFLVHTGGEGFFDKEIRELGGRIFRVPRFRFYNYFSYKKAVKDFFEKNHEFRAVQGHITSTAAIYLPIAKRAGIPLIIAHARSAGVDKGIKGVLTRLLRRNLSKKADFLFTCSELAGISVFGRKAVEAGKTVFVPNAIDCEAFEDDGLRRGDHGVRAGDTPLRRALLATDQDRLRRGKMREELGLSGKYVIGHVGRFHYAKNHEYLLQVFAALCKRGEKEYVLLLLGEGGGMEAAKKQAKDLGISDRVLFAGNKRNVYDYYQAMDYFVYPSRFEGLPGTVVEAQVSGLRCLMSDSICTEVMATELVHAMSIQDAPERWAEYIVDTQDYERSGRREQMEKAGFDVKAQARVMTRFYETGKFEEVL